MYDQRKSKSTKKAPKPKNPEWGNSAARAELKSMFMNDNNRTYLGMSAEDLQKFL